MILFKRVALALLCALALAPPAALAQYFGNVQPPPINGVAQHALCAGVVGGPCAPAGITTVAEATFTTPAGTTAYSTNDLIANSGTAGSVTPMSFTVCPVAAGSGMVRRARFKTADSGFSGKSVIIKLYKDLPTVTNGDNGAWVSTESNYLGSITVTADQAFSNPLYKGIGAPAVGGEINFDCATGIREIYGLEVAGEAATPQGAKTHAWSLEVLN